MFNLLFLIILVISFGGMLFIVIKRWPELRAIKILSSSVHQKSLNQRVKEKVKGLAPVGSLGVEKLIKKSLIKTKIIFMKGERGVDRCLRRVSYSQKFKDDYWEKMNKKK